jgi:hypothetical protein
LLNINCLPSKAWSIYTSCFPISLNSFLAYGRAVLSITIKLTELKFLRFYCRGFYSDISYFYWVG